LSASISRPLRVFLCDASQDKAAVRNLYRRLASENWIEPWLDGESLITGPNLDFEIYKATRNADVIIICLSRISVTKEGNVNKEIRHALAIAREKPQETIYVVALRLDDCNPTFEQLRKLHWMDYFVPNAHELLLKALRAHAAALQLLPPADEANKADIYTLDLDLYRFIEIPSTSKVPYSFWIGKYPVTNAQYERFLNASDYATESYWSGFSKFNEDCVQIGQWGTEGWDWLNKNKDWDSVTLKFSKNPSPAKWKDAKMGISNPGNPVVGVSWNEANAYCNWLLQHWRRLLESRANPNLNPGMIRLPLDKEWIIAAGGDDPWNRCPWDSPRQVTTDDNEVVKRANLPGLPPESIFTGKRNYTNYTTPVNAYLRGVSPRGVMDMAGNCWEWQANYENMEEGKLGLHGGIAYVGIQVGQLEWVRDDDYPFGGETLYGFRLLLLT
jgi:formylglycine-generating enzyme required for sulfatase activity